MDQMMSLVQISPRDLQNELVVVGGSDIGDGLQ